MAGSRIGRLVLVVDGDLGFLEDTRLLLQDERVLTARSLDLAMEIATGGRVDVVVLGPTFGSDAAIFDAARLLGIDPSIVIVLATNLVTNRMLRSALRMGFADVLDTPLTARRLGEVLDRSPWSKAEVAPAGDRPLTVGDDPVDLVFERTEADTAVAVVDPPFGEAAVPRFAHDLTIASGSEVVAIYDDTVRTEPNGAVAVAPSNGSVQLETPPPVAPPQPTVEAAPAPPVAAPPAPPVHEAPAPPPPQVEPTPPPAPPVPPPPVGEPPPQPPPMPAAPPPLPGQRPVDLEAVGLLPADAPMFRNGVGRVISVMAGKGGSGKTITATNLALAISFGTDPDRVAIVDADLQFGDVALLLQLDPSRTIVDAVRQLDELSEARLDSLLLRHESGLRVLPAPLLPVSSDEIPGKTVVQVLDRLRGLFDYVVVDTAPIFDDGLVTVLEHSDDVVVVVDMDLPSVKNAKIALDALRSAQFPMERVHLVVNRVNSKARLDLVELERSLGLRVSGSVPSDRLVPQSVNEGIPVVALSPRSKVARSFHDMAMLFLDDGDRRRR